MKTWYEELDFESNPFTIKPQESFGDFFGENNKIKDIISAIKKGSMILVKGDYGTGKTTILKAVIDEFRGKRKVAYYNCYEEDRNIDFEDLLINGGNFLSRLFSVRSKEMILLLDEAHNLMTRDLEDLPEYYNEGFFKSVVLVTSKKDHSFPKEIESLIDGNVFKLKMFGLSDARNLVENRLEDVSDIIPDEIIGKIYKKSKTPREFLMNCEDACRRAYERGSDVVEEVDVTRD